ncbi:cell division protein FtsK [Neisseria sicca]|jgi:hypothetical protein|uniref:Cell division protein FtsK n=1 Tax=Neisseria sicca TaxID=490 RepID=A0A2I1XBA5_NEISI|nr:FtsK/SpoIIIE domain-containing protein [Neisseria sicca]PLA39875.1 cell division protein FtsK [Neisseria sicca]
MYQIENGKDWDSELYHSLMERRLRSSKIAKDIKIKLETEDALPTLPNHYDWLMLCVSYCLIKGYARQEEKIIAAPDTSGFEISTGFKTAFQEFHHLWLAVLSDTLFEIKKHPCTTAELFDFIHNLWHTGAVELDRFWEGCKRFKPESELAQRQAFLSELAEIAIKNSYQRRSVSETESLDFQSEKSGDVTDRLKKAFLETGMPIKELIFLEHGIRYDIYRLRLKSYQELDKKHKQTCAALGLPENALHITPCHNGESYAFDVKLLRPEATWQKPSVKEFEEVMTQLPSQMVLPVCVGLDEIGRPCFEDLATAPHLLIGGTTGSGKSVLMRTVLKSLFVGCKSRNMLEVAILDPKKVDYRAFEQEEDLWKGRIIDDYDEMYQFLEDSVEEAEERYDLMKIQHVEKLSQLPDDVRPNYRVIVIDELSNLLGNKPEISELLNKLAEKARASGIHLILSTQRPSSEVLDGVLRSNVPSRIALGVQKSTESKIILDEIGAELLLGKGDHLVKWVGKPTYFQHGFNL